MQCGTVAEIQRAALHDAVLAGGLELHHQGPHENLQGEHGQHRLPPKGAGAGRVHSPQPSAGQQRQDRGCGYVIYETSHLSEPNGPDETACPGMENPDMHDSYLE